MFKSLFLRFLLITVLPIVILQCVMVYIFYERHWDAVSKRLENNLLGEIKVVVSLLDKSHIESAKQIASTLDFQMTEGGVLPKNYRSSETYLLDLGDKISTRINKPVVIEQVKNDLIIHINLSDKHPDINLRFSQKKLYSPTIGVFFMWAIGAASILILVSVGFMKNQVRAILLLADAAEKFGKGRDTGKIKISGAKEVRTVWKAFLRMKRRIYRQIYYRTQLLAHISHDLRTPLTRMRLATEFINNKETAEGLNQEIKFMENMIDEYLNFAKEEGNESSERVDIVKYINAKVAYYNNPKISFKSKVPKLVISLKPHAIERALNNLIDNALKFAHEKVSMKLSNTSSHWYLYLEDDGEGVPEEYFKKIFQPFFKLDKSSHGFGLGLAIVKSVIYSHGGKIKLAKSKMGGLRVIIKVPI